MRPWLLAELTYDHVRPGPPFEVAVLPFRAPQPQGRLVRPPCLLANLPYDPARPGPPFEVAVLPFGATEPHNLHLPYATDTLQVEVIAERACARAHERGARVVLLPAVPYGT